MTSYDSMAYNDPVGAAACRDAGRFGEPNPTAPSLDPPPVARDREEHEPCERGTVGCSVDHAVIRRYFPERVVDNVGCQTW